MLLASNQSGNPRLVKTELMSLVKEEKV